MTDLTDLDRALDALTDVERRALAVAAAELRDARAGAGDRRLADVWSALAVAAAEAGDRERSTIAAMQHDLDGGTVTFEEET